MIKRRVRKKRVKGKVFGYIPYLPKEYIDKDVYILTDDEHESFELQQKKVHLLETFVKVMREVINHESKRRKMFSIVTETWNPVSGCRHGCIYCWARRRAEALKNSERYREGFKPRLNREEFRKKFNGGLVFITDMGDLWGGWVPPEWIRMVLNHIRKFDGTYFLFMTKNPARYFQFLDEIPKNAILGATIETNRDDMYVEKGISGAPVPSDRYRAMKELEWDKKFIAIEPILDFDLDKFVKWIEEIEPFMVFVGYDNYNNRLPEPPLQKTKELIRRLSEFTCVIEKTIRPAWNEKQRFLG